MFENNLLAGQNLHLWDERCTRTMYAHRYNTAIHQFKSTLFKGKLSRLERRILRRPQRLYDLNSLKQNLSLRGSSYAGIQVVHISSILGSEGRTADFDIDFHPMSEAARERWVNMAIVHLSRLPLPPIQLIQVGDVYFVRDGHHRISVSRAFGQVAMDAEVIITWKVAPPFPWQPEAAQEAVCCSAPADVSV
jgi:hypothetical protein